ASQATIRGEDQLRAFREAGIQLPTSKALTLDSEIRLAQPIKLKVTRKSEDKQQETASPQWNSLFSDSDVHTLLASTAEDIDVEPSAIDLSPADDSASTPAENDIAIDKAIEIGISGRRKGLFAPDYILNVVRPVDGRDTILERTVRAVQVGTR